MQCPVCSSTSVKRIDGPYQYSESGLPNVWLLGIPRFECEACEAIDPKDMPPELKKLAEEAARLAREEADVRAQIEDEASAAAPEPAWTRRQQDGAIFYAGVLCDNALTYRQ